MPSKSSRPNGPEVAVNPASDFTTMEFLDKLITANTVQPETIQYFDSIPWTSKLLSDPIYEIIPTYSRLSKATGEDRLFSTTIHTPDTIEHMITLAKKDYRFQEESTTSSSSSTTTNQNTSKPPSEPQNSPSPTSTIVSSHLSSAIEKLKSIISPSSSPSMVKNSTPASPMSLTSVGPPAPLHPDTLTLMTLGPALDGHPGILHGGICSAILDETMGFCMMLYQRYLTGPRLPVFTAGLTLRYRAPTPTGTELLVKCWLYKKESERKWFTRGQIVTADGVVCVEAEALWVVARPRVQKL